MKGKQKGKQGQGKQGQGKQGQVLPFAFLKIYVNHHLWLAPCVLNMLATTTTSPHAAMGGKRFILTIMTGSVF